MLTLKDFSIAVGKKKILKDINFTFEEGKIYAIMGPNGSGKSTLAYGIMGHPTLERAPQSKITLNNEDITELDSNERADKGIFLSFQTPLSLAGVKVHQLIQLASKGKKKPLELRQEIQRVAKELRIHEDLLSRSLNEGASGGEKKKLEVLQAAVLDKDFLIFDEVDTGVDVDALKTIATFLEKNKTGKTYVIITHYTRILRYLRPDQVLVIRGGELKKVGDYSLAEEIEKDGYDKI